MARLSAPEVRADFVRYGIPDPEDASWGVVYLASDTSLPSS